MMAVIRLGSDIIEIRDDCVWRHVSGPTPEIADYLNLMYTEDRIHYGALAPLQLAHLAVREEANGEVVKVVPPQGPDPGTVA